MQGTNFLLHNYHPDQKGTKGPLTGKYFSIFFNSCYLLLYFLGAAIASTKNPKPTWVKAEKAEKVVDTTGAGDSFVGSLAFYLAHFPHLEMSEMVKRSCQIATISVQKEGTQTSFPYKKDLIKSTELFS